MAQKPRTGMTMEFWGGSGGKPYLGLHQKMIMTPKIRQRIDEAAIHARTVRPRRVGKAPVS